MKELRGADPKLAKTLPRAAWREGECYVPSMFALEFEHNSKHYLFNTFTKQLAEGCLPACPTDGKGYEELIENLFLVPAGKDECAFYTGISAVTRAFNAKKGFRFYTILPTSGCNARCVYCYEEGVKAVSMTRETVEQTVRFILDTHAGNRAELSWFGGEPLLRPDVIDAVCNGLAREGLEYRSKMVSNGSLITPAIVEKMAGAWRLASAQISMDGAECDYIPRKNYRVRADHYHAVLRGVDAMSAAGIRVTVRCNVDGENWLRVPAFLDDLSRLITNKQNVSVYFAPLFQAREKGQDLELQKQIIDARKAVAVAGFGAVTPGSHISKFRVFHCMADSGGVVIGPDGSLYPCEHCPPEARFGDIWQGVTDAAARDRFCCADNVREQCRACPFLPNCTGFSACPIADGRCREVQQMLTLALLKDLIDEKADDAKNGDTPDC